MPDATITSTASTFGTITGTFSADQSTVTGTITGVVAGTLSGSVGVPGPAGPAGIGLPAGGTSGQFLQKTSGVDYATDWVTLNLTGLATESWVTAGFYPLTGNPSNFLTASALTPYLTKADNLGSLTNFATARSNLGLGSLDTPTFAGVNVPGSGTSVANLGATFLTLNQQGHGQFTIQPSQGIVFPDASIQTTAYPGPPGATTWGSITGTLSSQTDLQSALDGKYSTTNPAGYITSSALTPYLLSSTAAATYQTLAGMSDYAQLSGATFTGNVFAPTPSPGTDSTRIATTEWVKDFDYAPTNSPHFTGNPQSVTPSLSDNDTSIATTAFVKGQSYLTSAALVGYATESFVTSALTGYATESWVTSQGYITSSALSPYLLSSTAASTYYLQTNPAGYINTTTLGNGSAPAGEDILDALQNAVAPSTSNPYATEGYTDSSISSFAATLSSTYATIASPSLTGVPLSTTASPGTNTQQIATTAFVTAAVPAFSTSTQSRQGTGTTTAQNPLGDLWQMMNPGFIPIIRSGLTYTATGTMGASGIGSYTSRMTMGTAGAASGSFRTFGASQIDQSFICVSKGYRSYIDFSRVTWCSGRFYTDDAWSDPQVSAGFYFGKAANSANGDLARKGFGWRINGNATPASRTAVLQVHNGTTLTNVSTSFALVAQQYFDWDVVSLGNGTVTLYNNGSEVATTTDGPTGDTSYSGTSPVIWNEEFVSTGTTSAYNATFSRGLIYIAP